MRLIDADALLTAYCDDCNSGVEKPCPVPGRCHEYNLIKEQPTITAEPVKCGKWFLIRTVYDLTKWVCSECGHYVPNGSDRNYCPNCGSKMQEEVQE